MDNRLKKFILGGIISEILYLFIYALNFLKPVFNDQKIVLHNNFLFFLLIATLTVLLLIYAKLFNLIGQNNIPLKYIIGLAVLFNFTLLFVWPLASADLFSYVSYGRIISEYHANPYLTPYSIYSQDKLYENIKTIWSVNTAPYGPLFVAITGGLAYLAGDSLALNIFLFKLFFTVSNVFSIFLIYKLCRRREAVFLLAWNPFLIFEFAGNGHNDIVMIVLLLLALLFFLKNRFGLYLLGWMFLCLSVLIKFFTLLLLPVYLILAARLLPPAKKPAFLLSCFLIGAGVLILFYWPFWRGMAIFSRTGALLGRETVFASLGVLSLGSVLYYFKITGFYHWSKTINKIGFVLFYLFILGQLFWNTKQNKTETLFFYAIIIFSVFFTLFFTWLMPWYLTLLISLLAVYIGLSKKYKYAVYIYAVSLYAISFYFILR